MLLPPNEEHHSLKGHDTKLQNPTKTSIIPLASSCSSTINTIQHYYNTTTFNFCLPGKFFFSYSRWVWKERLELLKWDVLEVVTQPASSECQRAYLAALFSKSASDLLATYGVYCYVNVFRLTNWLNSEHIGPAIHYSRTNVSQSAQNNSVLGWQKYRR